MVQSHNRRDAVAILHDFFTNPSNTATKLDLSACNLKELPRELDALIVANPSAAARLELLNLAHNALTTLPASLARLPSLRILFLLSNAFTAVPAVVSELAALRMLSFKSNNLTGELRASSLPPNLTWLILTSNALTSLSPDFAARCRRVRKLMLANNRLGALPPLAPHMADLELLRLANNRLAAAPRDLFALPRLKWLALAANPGVAAPAAPRDLPAARRVALRDFAVDWAAPLGHGASGAAYAATHRASGARVVAKRFRAAEGSDGRAVDEIAVTLAASGADGVVRATGWTDDDIRLVGADGGCDDALPMLFLDRVQGDARTLADGPSFASCTRSVYREHEVAALSDDEIRVVVDGVKRAVRELWARGICHGDVYAHNIMVGRDENGIVVRLGDLGAAWIVPEELRERAFAVEQRALDVFCEEMAARTKQRL